MKIRKTPDEIWKEYEKGISYNTGLELYENVERNNNFYNDKQWEGVNAPDLDKPVFNFLKPVVSYYVAMLISDDIAVNVETMDGGAPEVPKIIAKEVDGIIERANMKYKNRRMLKNCAIDGDGCFYIWFDPETGEIKIDLVDNTNVLFGNPTEAEAEAQPYILIAYRRLTEDVKDEARANGLNADGIVADSDNRYANADKDADNDYTTVVLKLWKERGTVRFMKCTKTEIVKKETDTEYTRYPLAWMSWEGVKNSYHGISPITGKIPNQIFVNKIYAMAQMQVQNFAFPKMLYDRTKIPAWDNRIGKAVGVAGNPNEAIFSGFRAPDMSADVLNMAEMTIRQTKDMMGASDAALGNVKPDNTSAIIAVQKASSMPLDIQRMDFYNFIESCVRIFIEIMRVNYGTRGVGVEENEGTALVDFDFSTLGDVALNLNIEIGQGSYWSELMQVQTLDNLMANKVIPDALTYLEAVPEGYIKNKNKIIERVKAIQGMMPGMPEAPLGAMPMGEMPQEVPAALPEEMPPEMTGEMPMEGPTGDDVSRILLELRGMPAEEAMEVLDEMDIPQEAKALIAQGLEGGQDGGQMR